MAAPFRTKIFLLLALLGVLFLADVAVGSISIPLPRLFSALLGQDSLYTDIIWQFRLPKAITCLLAGGALATAGLLMQTLFRNPMAGPDVLGLSSGSSLLVAILIMAGQYTSGLSFLATSPWAIALAASLGSALVFILVIIIARNVKDNTSLLIIGLMIGAGTASIVGVLQFIGTADDLQSFMIWTLGNVGNTNWTEINVLAFVIFISLIISIGLMKALNGWLLGENYAHNLGIHLGRSRLWIVIATGMLTGSVTAFCGPIAFVGLAVPHLVRLFIPTTNHKILMPAVLLGGASFLLLCDLLAQLPGSTQLLPLNAVTSLIGAPVVIWMVIKAKKIHV